MEFKKKKGFTLIELLVVISIIGLLTSIIMSSLSDARKKARGAKFVSEMNQLKTAFELYRNDRGQYPFERDNLTRDDISYVVLTTTLSDGKGLNNELVDNKYISSISELSECTGVCGGGLTEDYGYLTGSSAANWGPCGGKTLSSYLFYVVNSQINSNYSYLDNYPLYFCFGQ